MEEFHCLEQNSNLQESKEIYINASKVSYFTKFKFSKITENDIFHVLLEHNSWLNEFIGDIVKPYESTKDVIKMLDKKSLEHLDVSISSENDSESSEDTYYASDYESTDTNKKIPHLSYSEITKYTIDKETHSMSYSEITKDDKYKDDLTLDKKVINVTKKLDKKINKAIYSDDDSSKELISKIDNVKLSEIAGNTININRGILKESEDIRKFENDSKCKVTKDNKFYKKELFKFKHRNCTYIVKVGGKHDGLCDKNTILETKHRSNRLFYFIPEYEKVQMEMYIFLIDNATKCIHQENFKKNGITTSNKSVYEHDISLLEKIKKQLKKYLINFINEYIEDS